MSLFRSEFTERRQNRLHGEVVLTQPISIRILAVVLFSIIVVIGFWITLGTYARVETVSGMLVTEQPSARVFAQQEGTVAELSVIEGQKVKKGDQLLVIHSDRQLAGGGDVAGRSLEAVEARRQLSEAQLALVDTRAAAERSRLLAVISSAEVQSSNLLDQVDLQEQVVASNQKIFDQLAEVVERGFVAKIEYERRRQTLLSSQQTLSNLRQRLAGSVAEAEEARAQLSVVGVDAAQGVTNIQEDLQTLLLEKARLEGEHGYVVTAPIDGRVTALTAGVGRPASVGRPLMMVVPVNTELQAELYAPTRAVGMVEPGKEVRLLYDAFPYQKFGSFRGKVSSIARIAVDPREMNIPFPIEEPIYRVRVVLDKQFVDAYGKPTLLQPGMTLQASVVLERQTFLEWMLEPLNAVLNRTS